MKEVVYGILVVLLITLARYFTIAGMAFVVFYRWLSRRLVNSKRQARQATRKHFMFELLHSVVSSVALAITGYIVVAGPLRSYTLVYADLHAWPLWWMPLSLVLALIIHDTYFYWIHRLMHHDRIFRYVHLVHHRSVNPSPWAAYSFHFIEAVLEGAVIILLAFVLPLHLYTISAFVFIAFVINVYGHLGYEIMPEGFRHSFLFGFINTSCYHNLHHSKFKGNYSLYFRCWDRLLKTEHPDYVKVYDRIQQQRFGQQGTAGPPKRGRVAKLIKS